MSSWLWAVWRSEEERSRAVVSKNKFLLSEFGCTPPLRLWRRSDSGSTGGTEGHEPRREVRLSRLLCLA